jgi:hypothetical protein
MLANSSHPNLLQELPLANETFFTKFASPAGEKPHLMTDMDVIWR